MDIFEQCRTFLSTNAVGKWHETPKFKDGDGYIHHISSDMVLLRVETDNYRSFYWIYDINDAIEFNKFITDNLNTEAHEIIVGNCCRLFYDIDLKLDYLQKYELAEYYGFELSDENQSCVMDILGENIANIYKEATLVSLQEHGNDKLEHLSNFDWMFCMRNRPCGEDFKISIHIITNLYLRLNICAAIAHDVKTSVLVDNCKLFQIDESIASYLSEAIDSAQYRLRGSLGLPMGVKKTECGYCKNVIRREYNIPMQQYFITIPDQFSLQKIELLNYDIVETYTRNTFVDSTFIQNAIKHIGNISDYNPCAFDVSTSVVKNSTMYVRRYAASECSVCDRIHDNDNTLFLMFDSERKVASWKCMHAESMTPITFYTEEDIDEYTDDDINGFLTRYSSINTNTTKINTTETDVAKKIKQCKKSTKCNDAKKASQCKKAAYMRKQLISTKKNKQIYEDNYHEYTGDEDTEESLSQTIIVQPVFRPDTITCNTKFKDDNSIPEDDEQDNPLPKINNDNSCEQIQTVLQIENIDNMSDIQEDDDEDDDKNQIKYKQEYCDIESVIDVIVSPEIYNTDSESDSDSE